jgi:hypothetical protein
VLDETNPTVELCDAGTVTTNVSDWVTMLVTRVVVVPSARVESEGTEGVLQVLTPSVFVIGVL